MKKIFLFTTLIFNIAIISAQKTQRIAYIDMEYILENVPEYLQAQNALDTKVVKWRKNLDKQERHIEILKTDLANEKAILTKDLIEEKEEEILLKQQELRRLESLYFGPNGDLFLLRKQLVKPIQDQVYNAIQSIVARKKYDFVFDKSSDLVMLYSNKKYDISELILSTINRERKVKEKKERKNEKKKKNIPKKELTTKQKGIVAQKNEAEEKRKVINEKKKNDREALKKAIAEKRAAQLKLKEEKRKLLREKKEALRKKKEQEKKNKKNNN